jgi:hypothetical protein
MVANLTHLCSQFARRTIAQSLLGPNDSVMVTPLPRLLWLWGWTYDYDEMIADLREIWPDVEKNTVLLHMILSHVLVEADLSDQKAELNIAWEEGKVKVIVALGIVYTNGDLPRRKSVPSRLPTSTWREKFWARRTS